MRRKGIHVLLFIASVAMLSCDFPSDPPLKNDSMEVTPLPDEVDSTKTLLPLKGNESWTFFSAQQGRPSPPRTVSLRFLEKDGEKFAFVPYLHFPPMGPAEVAFPALLRNDTLGLSFYQPYQSEDTIRLQRFPKHIFTLPFPARRGTQWKHADYRVFCTHTDTLLNVWGTGVQLPTYRYEVWRGPMWLSTLYVVRNVAVLRVETYDVNYHTFSWRL